GVNSVSLVGQLTADPQLRTNRTGTDECRMRIAVQRRQRGGDPDTGVVYVEVTTHGRDAREMRHSTIARRPHRTFGPPRTGGGPPRPHRPTRLPLGQTSQRVLTRPTYGLGSMLLRESPKLVFS